MLLDYETYVTLVSTHSLHIYPDNISSQFSNYLYEPIVLDPSLTYVMGVCDISYCDSYRGKDPVSVVASSSTTTEKPVKKFFGKSAEDNVIVISQFISARWLFTKDAADIDEFYAQFIVDANKRFPGYLKVIAEYDRDGDPITKFVFTDENNKYTLRITHELALVLGFSTKEFKPGNHTSSKINEDAYSKISADTEFALDLYYWEDKKYIVAEPDEYTLDALIDNVVHVANDNDVNLTMPIMPGDYIRLQLDFSDNKVFKVQFPPVLNNILQVPPNYAFTHSTEILYKNTILREDEDNHSIKPQNVVYKAQSSDIAYIHCSLVEQSFIGKGAQRILRTFPREKALNKVTYRSFDSVLYHRLQSTVIQSIDISLKDLELNILPAFNYPTTITCHIKQVYDY